MNKLKKFFYCLKKKKDVFMPSITKSVSLEGKVAVVTGAGRGIGKAIVLKLANAGMNVCFCSRTQTDIDKVTAELSELKKSFLAQRADMTKLIEVQEFAKSVEEKFGSIFLLVNNVGESKGGQSLRSSSVEEWEKCVQLNLFSAFYVTKTFLPLISIKEGGHICNLGSGVGHFPPPKPSSAYSTSKAALWMLTRCASIELQHSRINVNEVLPGPVSELKNNYFTSGDYEDWVKTPDDVAKLILWLAEQKPGEGPTGQSFSLHRRPL